MSISAKDLAGKFRKENRYANFGECVNAMKMHEIRGVSCKIEFEYPVTAITGSNGVGKTTIGQLLICAYRKLPEFTITRHLLGSYFRGSSRYASPFNCNSYVEYFYQSSNQDRDKAVLIRRLKSGWHNYKHQPEKSAILIDPIKNIEDDVRGHIMQFNRDYFFEYKQRKVENASMWLSRIFGTRYSEAYFEDIGYFGESCVVRQPSIKYSKGNLGFGEYRVINIIRFLEECPKKSFIFLDEPDIGLHASAQHEFASYLIDVSYRQGHQIVFTTHSPEIIEPLPPQGRIMLERGHDGVSVHNRVSSIHIRNALSHGKHGFLVVCVEDEFAKALLEEIIISSTRSLYSRIKVCAVGDHRSVRNAVYVLRKAMVSVIGVLDGDQAADRENDILTFPGNRVPPEKLVFNSSPVKRMLLVKYGFDFDQYITAHPDADHHDYSRQIEQETSVRRQKIDLECIQRFLESKPKNWSKDLVGIFASHA